MEANTQTTLFELQEGDRFYFVGDPRKAVLEIGNVIKHYRSGRVLHVIYKDLKEGHRDRPVVFLRNIKEGVKK
jgi:hypothetical protein